MAFVDELKQRKVVRVAVAYLVVAWLGVQVASIALPAFDAPSWVLRVVILLLALGFPMALILAWAIDLTPDGPRYSPGGTGWKRMVAISVGIGGLALAWYFVGQPAWRDKPSATAVAATVPATAVAPQAMAADARSIAVLPFVNMSKDPANEYFSDGLAETTLDMLAQIHDLKVIARTSSFAFKGKNSDVREIGRALDAAHLLEGSVQQSGNTLRITAQLIRVSDGTHLWSEQYDRQLTDVFKIQDEIAAEVVKALQLALPVDERRRLTEKRTENLAAYQQYLRGNALLPRRRVSDMRAALAHFERAIALDPEYAGAYAAASMTLGLLEAYSGDANAAAREKRNTYANKALQLNPGLGEGYAARATILQDAHNLAGADENFRRAIEFSPSFASAYQWYAEFLQNDMGDYQQSLPLINRAVELDPLSPAVRNEQIFALAVGGKSDEALAASDLLLRQHPDFSAGYAVRATILEYKGDLIGALRLWQQQIQADPAATNRHFWRCFLLLRYGAPQAAEACAQSLAARSDPDRWHRWQVQRLVARGDFEQAYALAQERPQPEAWDMVMLQWQTGRNAEALAGLQVLTPEFFMQPLGKIKSDFSVDALIVGSVLVRSGAVDQGRAVLREGIRLNARHTHTQMMYGRGWSDALIYSELGDYLRACAALAEAVDAGYVMDLSNLDFSPIAAGLRKQPCFAPTTARVRANLQAQREAAKKAGLL